MSAKMRALTDATAVSAALVTGITAVPPWRRRRHRVHQRRLSRLVRKSSGLTQIPLFYGLCS